MVVLDHQLLLKCPRLRQCPFQEFLEIKEINSNKHLMHLIIKELGLTEARPVSTPGEAEMINHEEENAKPLGDAEASKFRALAARANYLSADRPECQFGTKEVCRFMPKPTKLGDEA